jgi:hypothetical protein
MKIARKPIFQILVTIGAFFAALAFRLIRLGSLPLTDVEALAALQALAVGQRGDAIFGPHMAYVGLTGLDFFLLEASEFLARFWPAFFGALIVFIPFLFKEKIGGAAASLLSLILAISPEMVGSSRIVGTPMMAFVCLLLAWGFIFQKKPVLSGVMFALGLMSGRGFWTGIVVVGISFLAASVLFGEVPDTGLISNFKRKKFRIRFFLAFIVTILLIGTGFFLAPEGLSGVLSGTMEYVLGLRFPTDAPFFLKPLALIAYSFPAVLFGIWGGISGLLKKNKRDIFLLIWAAAGLIYLFLYLGATPGDVIWVTFPLWTLAARLVSSLWHLPEDNRSILVITAVVVVVVFAFMLLTTRALVQPNMDQESRLINFIALVGGLVLLIAVALLVSYGWSEEISLQGLLIGLAVVSVFSMVSLSVRTTGLSSKVSFELWQPDEPKLSTRWLKLSIDRVWDWNKRRTSPVEMVVVDFDTPGMRWALRDYDKVAFVPALPPTSQPEMIISNSLAQPEISNSYRGQDLVWSTKALWREMSAFDTLTWLIARDAPDTKEEIIFWVRTDLMPDGQFRP